MELLNSLQLPKKVGARARARGVRAHGACIRVTAHTRTHVWPIVGGWGGVGGVQLSSGPAPRLCPLLDRCHSTQHMPNSDCDLLATPPTN